jgi:hypothetical protein
LLGEPGEVKTARFAECRADRSLTEYFSEENLALFAERLDCASGGAEVATIETEISFHRATPQMRHRSPSSFVALA